MANKLLFSVAFLFSVSAFTPPEAQASKSVICDFVYGVGHFLFPKYDAEKMLQAARDANKSYLVDVAFGKQIVDSTLTSAQMDNGRVDQMIDEKIQEMENLISGGPTGLRFKDYKKELEMLQDLKTKQSRQVAPTVPNYRTEITPVGAQGSDYIPSSQQYRVTTEVLPSQPKLTAEDVSKIEFTPYAKASYLITVMELVMDRSITVDSTLKSYMDKLIKKAKLKEGVMTRNEQKRAFTLIVQQFEPMQLPDPGQLAASPTNMLKYFGLYTKRLIAKAWKPDARKQLERDVLRDPMVKSFYESLIAIDYLPPRNGIVKRSFRNFFALVKSAVIDVALLAVNAPPVALPGLKFYEYTGASAKARGMAFDPDKGMEEGTKAMIRQFNIFRNLQTGYRPVRKLLHRGLLVFTAYYLAQHPQILTYPFEMFKVYQSTNAKPPTDAEINAQIDAEESANTASSDKYDVQAAVQQKVDEWIIEQPGNMSDQQIAAARGVFSKVSDTIPKLETVRLSWLDSLRKQELIRAMPDSIITDAHLNYLTFDQSVKYLKKLTVDYHVAMAREGKKGGFATAGTEEQFEAAARAAAMPWIIKLELWELAVKQNIVSATATLKEATAIVTANTLWYSAQLSIVQAKFQNGEYAEIYGY